VGFKPWRHLAHRLIVEALAADARERRPPTGVMLPQRPRQYTSRAFANFCHRNSVVPRGDFNSDATTCFDNALAESFFATYKKRNSSHTRHGMTSRGAAANFFGRGYSTVADGLPPAAYLTPIEYELDQEHRPQLKSCPTKSETLNVSGPRRPAARLHV